MLPPIPANPELEKAIVLDFYNPDLWSVYADYLQSLNHPLGEMVALELEYRRYKKPSKMREAMGKCMEKAYAQGMVGRDFTCDGFLRPLCPQGRNENDSSLGLSWEMGFIHLIRICVTWDEHYKDNLQDLTSFLRTPFTHLLMHLELQFPTWENPKLFGIPESFFTDMLHIFQDQGAGAYLSRIQLSDLSMVTRPQPTSVANFLANFAKLTRLELGGRCYITDIPNPNLRSLQISTNTRDPEMYKLLESSGMPLLEELELVLHGAASDRGLVAEENLGFLLNNPRLQSLTRLDLQLDNPGDGPVRTLKKLHFPNLKQLSIRVHGRNNQWKMFLPFFERVKTPALEELSISFTGRDGDCLQALVKSEFPVRLKRIRLGQGMGESGNIQMLLKHKAHFSHLESLTLENTYITGKLRDELTKAFGNRILL